jgi:hypothetical protein
MTRNRLVILTLGIWTALFALSFVLLFTLEPTGDGFVRGLNRVAAFLIWQGVAFIAAVIALLAGRGISSDTPGARWFSRIPVIVQSLMLLALIGLILAVRVTKPAAEPGIPPGPATAPAPALNARAWLEEIGEELAYLGIVGGQGGIDLPTRESSDAELPPSNA